MSSPQEALCVLAEVEAGQEDLLVDDLRRLPDGEASPFGRIEGTHFARWVFVPYLEDRYGYPAGPSAYLLFSAEFDGGADAFVERLRTQIPDEADTVWGHCRGYRGAADHGAFQAFLSERAIQPGYSFSGYPNATVEEIRRAADMRDRLIRFAVAHDGADASTLRSGWLEAFPPEEP